MNQSLNRSRAAALAAALIAALVLAACGGSSHHSPTAPQPATGGQAKTVAGGSHSGTGSGSGTGSSSLANTGCQGVQQLCVTKSTAFKPKGSSYIDENLQALMARNQPKLKHPVVTCPQAQHYPVNCQLRASMVVRGKLVPAKGTVTVLGVEVHTRTYAYALTYAPVTGK